MNYPHWQSIAYIDLYSDGWWCGLCDYDETFSLKDIQKHLSDEHGLDIIIMDGTKTVFRQIKRVEYTYHQTEKRYWSEFHLDNPTPIKE